MVKISNAYVKGIKIKAVKVNLGKDEVIHRDISRIYVNKDGSVTVQRVANEPAIARYPFVNDLTYIY